MASPERCWYVAYGSNLSRDRFECYLLGGCPPGGRRTYAGARDPSSALADRPCWIPGSVYFARESLTWTGGMAFLDPGAPDSTPARAYLLTCEQFGDVLEQEVFYDWVVDCPPIDGLAAHAITTTEPVDDTTLAAPAPAYLSTLIRGLQETHGWSARRAAEHLIARPGARGVWTADAALAALTAA